MFLFQVASNAHWSKVQRAAILELQKLKATEELDKLKLKITDDNLLELLNKPVEEKATLNFLKKLFG
jgi:hypothetical protein